jgi:Ca2+/Na+ antiporter
MGFAIGLILLLIFISWMNVNDCWALGLTTFFVCFVLMFIGVWQNEQEKKKKNRGF